MSQILIVDDVADNLFLLKSFLESEGYSVEVAHNGAAAIEKMRLSPPALVLLDVMMPEVNGYDLTRSIRRDDRLRAIPVILITAYIEACRIKGVAVGANDFIRKPIQFGELLSRIQQLMGPGEADTAE